MLSIRGRSVATRLGHAAGMLEAVTVRNNVPRDPFVSAYTAIVLGVPRWYRETTFTGPVAGTVVEAPSIQDSSPAVPGIVTSYCTRAPAGPSTLHTKDSRSTHADETANGSMVGVGVGVLVAVADGVTVGVRVGVTVGVLVGVRVGVAVGVRVGVTVGVLVAVGVGVTVGVRVGVAVGVGVAHAASVLLTSATPGAD
jgi:hypothetical protein